MNIPVAMTYINNQNLDYVPTNGELVLDIETNRLKMGDGKTAIKDLPYISTAEAYKESVPDYVKQIIKQYSNLIEENKFNELLDNIIPSAHTDVVRALLKAGIDVKSHLNPIPPSVQHLFEENDWSLDLDRMYTKAEIDAKIHDATNHVISKINKMKEKI